MVDSEPVKYYATASLNRYNQIINRIMLIVLFIHHSQYSRNAMTPYLRISVLLSCLLSLTLTFLPNQLSAKNASTFLNNPIIIGKVIGISDGDTITVLQEDNTALKIRLAGIDCPEKSQAFGNRAKKMLSEKVFGNIVRVEIRHKDRYDRTLGIIRLGDLDINEYLITQGVAWHYKAYAKDQPDEEAKRYDLAEQGARKAKKGLWLQEHPTPPWEYRAQKKKD